MRLPTVRLQSALSESLGNNVALAETLWKRLDIHVQKNRDTSDEYEPIVADIIKMYQPLRDDVSQAAGVLGLKKRSSTSGRKSKTAPSEPEQTEEWPVSRKQSLHGCKPFTVLATSDVHVVRTCLSFEAFNRVIKMFQDMQSSNMYKRVECWWDTKPQVSSSPSRAAQYCI